MTLLLYGAERVPIKPNIEREFDAGKDHIMPNRFLRQRR